MSKGFSYFQPHQSQKTCRLQETRAEQVMIQSEPQANDPEEPSTHWALAKQSANGADFQTGLQTATK